jgi:hypothetical protein
MRRTSATELDRKVWHHYNRYWGEPTDSYRFDASTRHSELTARTDLPDIVDVMVFASREDNGASILQLATIGMSNLPMRDGSRAELEITCRGLDPARSNELARLLANLALYPFAYDAPFGWGQLVKDIEGLRGLSTMRAAMLQRPNFEDPAFAIVEPDGVRVMWVIPLHDDEYEYAASRSVDALEDKLEAAGTDVLDLRRSSALRYE